MGHRNARLNVRGRSLLVERVLGLGRPVAHVAKELGVSRQCAHRWIGRFCREGEGGLRDRSARPQRSPRRTSTQVEAHVLELRRVQRRGPEWIGAELGIPPRTVSAILRRQGVPRLADCDPLTGELIRASRQTTHRYERQRPGELVHMDVKKLGRIPDGGGWRAAGGTRAHHAARRDTTPIGYDYVHSLIDDHSRFAYSEILPDEQGRTSAQFLLRAAEFFAAHGIGQIQRVMTDNAWGLPLLARRGGPSAECKAGVYPSALPMAERQGGAPEPHAAKRVGLPPTLQVQCRARRGACAVAGALHQSTASLRSGRPSSDQPTVINVTAEYT